MQVNDYQKMREGVGLLLAELMRIKAEGDYAAIKALVDKYGVHFDPALRDQVVARYKQLNLPTYWAGINPELTAQIDAKASAAAVTRRLSARRRPSVSRIRPHVRCGPAISKMTNVRTTPSSPLPATTARQIDRPYLLERIGEAAVVQLYADGFRDLPLREKTLIWHLYQAAIAGRDIFYDQRYAHNLEMRDVLEAILTHASGIDPATLDAIERYTKLFWINTGPYNNLTARKFVLACTPEAFLAAAAGAARAGAALPTASGRERSKTWWRACVRCSSMRRFEPSVTQKTPPAGGDILAASANNLYVGVTMKDLEAFEERYPLNSRLVKKDGQVVEEVYRVGGRYDKAIAAIVGASRGGDPVCDAVDGQGAARVDSVLSDRRRTATARRTTSPGCRTRTRPSTRSTASSRSTSTRAASRAHGKRSSST